MKPTKQKSNATNPSTADSASAKPARRPKAAGSLLDACNASPRLQAFLTVIDAAGLSDLLQSKGPLTVFAPTDVAFNRIAPEVLAALLNDKARLINVLQHHVVAGRVKAPREAEPRSVTPQFGDALRLTSAKGSYHVDDARIVKTNLRATNGVIHAIDTVLMPHA